MPLRKTKAMVPLLALPLAAGSAIAMLTAGSATSAAASCAEMSFTNPYLGYREQVPRATLRQGSTGSCVTILQQDLNFTIHAGLKVTADFDANTLAAVKTYQADNRACTGGVTGVADHDTMSCLVAGSG